MLDITSPPPKELKIGDRTYLVGPMKLKELSFLTNYIRDHSESPIDRARKELEFAPQEEHQEIKHKAFIDQRDNWPPSPASDEGAKALFNDINGQKFFIGVFLGKHNEISDGEVDEIVGIVGVDGLSAMIQIGFGPDDVDISEVWQAIKTPRRNPESFVKQTP